MASQCDLPEGEILHLKPTVLVEKQRHQFLEQVYLTSASEEERAGKGELFVTQAFPHMEAEVNIRMLYDHSRNSTEC